MTKTTHIKPFLIAFLFLIIAISFFAYPFLFQTTSPYILLSSDAGNVASILATWFDQESFAKDLLYSNPKNYEFYISALLPIGYILTHFTQDIGLSFHLLIIPLLYFQMSGFYRLGLYLFPQKQTYALILALSNLVYINIGGGEYWGIYSYEAISRVFVNAFLPFFLIFLLKFENQKARWWLLFLMLSIAFYFHTVSIPTLAFSLGFTLLFKPFDIHEKWMERIKYLTLNSLFFIALLTPFIYLYFSAFVHDNTMNEGMLNTHVGKYFQDSHYALSLIFNSKLDWAVIILGYIGFYKSKSDEANLLCLYLTGIILGSLGLATFDQFIAEQFDRAPLQFDLIRNMRFIYPLSLIGIIYLCSDFKKVGVYLFAAFMILVAYKNPLHYFIRPTLKEHRAVELNALMTYSAENQKHINFIKNLNLKEPVLPIGNDKFMDIESLAFRYQAYQPIAYTRKDRNFLIYTNSSTYSKWEVIQTTKIELLKSPDRESAEEKIQELLKETNAQFIYFDTTVKKKELLIPLLNAYAEPIFKTDNRILFKVKK